MSVLEAVAAYEPDALNEGNLGKRLEDPEIEARVEAVLARLTLEQKVARMAGTSFAPVNDLFETAGEPSHAIPALKMVDGPRGARAGISTTFPVAMARGATFDPALEARVGEAIALEARAHGANVLLAPCINLLRHPGWGRAQETYGEDPLHVGRMGAGFIAGAQRHLVASAKHLALNSIENSRFEVDVRADARTLHEVYLPHFERAVREAHVGSVMTAYNKVNGTYCAENAPLVREVLRGRWGFRGFVESDWVFGTRSTVASALAGLDIEMPLAHHYGRPLLEAVKSGELDVAFVDDAVRRILRVSFAFGLDVEKPIDRAVLECHAHAELALEVAEKSLVLLKNQHGLLPLAAKDLRRVAVLGKLSSLENTGDRGSSAVRSSFVTTPLEGIRDRIPRVRIEHLPLDVLGGPERALVSNADAAIVVVGLTWRDEGEYIPLTAGGGDRTSLRLRAEHEQLIREVAALNARTIVVLISGSAVEVRPWVDGVPALVFMPYAGVHGGEALARLLFGDASPSGKLPLSFPRSVRDLPAFDPNAKVVRYEREHGYTYLERHGREPEFAFGHGLSYTRFVARRLELSREHIAPSEPLIATVEVANEGSRAGDEVVQLYASMEVSRVARARRWLVGFGRVSLAPGERKLVEFVITGRELAYFDEGRGELEVESGTYALSAGTSLHSLPLRAWFHVRGGL